MTSWRPGDRREATDSMIRVDQAGEFGATRIYAGQLAVLGDRSPAARKIAAMAVQEAEHRAFFDAMMARRGVRPTLFSPLWDTAGYALGAITATIGPEAAMACTVAVETEIDKHYADQLVDLGDDDPELATAVTKFRDEELEHKATALASGAEMAPAYPVMSALIRLGCRAAIAVAKRV
jgi:ubiquinone biosynthesis monooxygenase Coq7